MQVISFYSAYPDVPVREQWKAGRVKQACDALLDQASS